MLMSLFAKMKMLNDCMLEEMKKAESEQNYNYGCILIFRKMEAFGNKIEKHQSENKSRTERQKRTLPGMWEFPSPKC
jgi:hypothetical protein